jgi:hypothetical protein
MAGNDIFPVFGAEHVQEFRAKVTSEELEELGNLFGVPGIIAPESTPSVLSVSLFLKPVDKAQAEAPKPTKELMQGTLRCALRSTSSTSPGQIQPACWFTCPMAK